MEWYLLVFEFFLLISAFVLGTIIGSLLNVCISACRWRRASSGRVPTA